MVSTTSNPTPSTHTTTISSFYLLRNEPPTPSDISGSGSSNLLVQHGLEQSFQKFCGKKVKENLSAFLPHLPGYIDEKGTPENSLRSVIDKPPIGGKELLPLPSHALSGFRLNPGPIPEQFRLMNQQPPKKKHKHKKHKSQEVDRVKGQLDTVIGTALGQPSPADSKQDTGHERKHKKQKKHDDGERKKKKKEKKKKKRHTPDPVLPGDSSQTGGRV